MCVHNLIANINIDLQFFRAYQESDIPILFCVYILIHVYMSITHENIFQRNIMYINKQTNV